MNPFEMALRIAIEEEERKRDGYERRRGIIALACPTNDEMRELHALGEAIALCDERIRFSESILSLARAIPVTPDAPLAA